MIYREAEDIIMNISKTFKVLLVTGPRQVGKTTLLMKLKPDDMNYVTFDDNEELAKAAVAAGVWFDTFDFTPAEKDKVNIILSTLKEGNRAKITDAISKYGKDEVVNVATYHVEELTTAVVSMLENLLKIQLVID